MSENLYDTVPYVTYPRIHTHPDRLAAVGTLFGMKPAPLRQCRVLEIGCGDATNLIPIAYALPESRFTGIDLADAPIAAGRRTIGELGLENMHLVVQDLCTMGSEYGEFDYILAHGVYSWIPRDVRDGLMATCARVLAPQGIALISYNALPGWQVRKMLRDMMLHHIRNLSGPAARIEQARWFLRFLIGSGSLSHSWQTMFEAEVKAVLERTDDSLYHDELAPYTEPIYFRDFVAHASRHGLQFLGDAEPHSMFDPAGSLDWLSGDLLEREQYLDFMRARRFRYTLLCRQGVELHHSPPPEQMQSFLFSCSTKELEGGELQGLRGIRITSQHDAVHRVARAMGETFPLPLPFDELVPYAGSREALQTIVFGLATSGFADIHVFDFPCEVKVTAKPRANRLVRYQAAQSPLVTNVCHQTVELDEVARHLVLLMDGTRDHERIARDLAAIPGAPPLDKIREHLLGSLNWLAGMALLEA